MEIKSEILINILKMILFWGIPKCEVWNNDEMEEYCLLLDNIHPDKIQIKCER